MAEFLDVYDANRKFIGPADRNVVHACGLWHKTVHCWIIWNGKMVFQRRSRRLDNNPGKLYTTASGHVSAGESIPDAFSREIMQEVGVMPKDPKFLDETVWIADIKKSDGAVIVDRVFSNVFYAKYDGELDDFGFSDGEVDSVAAIDLSAFAKWSHDPASEIPGTEWDGEKLADVMFMADDFLLNNTETIYSKYGKIAEKIKNDEPIA